MLRSNYGYISRNFKFSDVWPEGPTQFKTEYLASGLAPATNKISDDSVSVLYYLLCARYANNVIASSDVGQFKYQVWALIFQYGPSWEKRLEIQNKLRGLTDEELLQGSVTINNHAYNPGQAPTTQTTTELDYINDQSVSKSRRGKLGGFSLLLEELKTDVTAEFLSKFRSLFLSIAQPERPLWYVTDEETTTFMEED